MAQTPEPRQSEGLKFGNPFIMVAGRPAPDGERSVLLLRCEGYDSGSIDLSPFAYNGAGRERPDVN